MNSISSFIERKLKLKVNKAKSAVDRPWKRKFLGFTFGMEKEKPQIRTATQSLQRVKAKIKAKTSRRRSPPMEIRIRELNQYLMGWCGYYALAETKSVFQELDAWTRRRLRMCKWKQWNLPRTKTRELISLGIPKHKAYEWGNSRKKYWRIALSPVLSRALGNQYWATNGLQSLTDRYKLLRNMT
ncbi:group II intron maturase [Paenibacillus cellulosilyticus]|uniref:Group II intron maturase n=1 Tax=Paenibacillus cellulosilyticus TaxID=375489 RepID=A0A2V2YS22_9BACL|nr:group II intron maturase [Paenibacillus cellulosilyticus]